jgi:hypothetical protein
VPRTADLGPWSRRPMPTTRRLTSAR